MHLPNCKTFDRWWLEKGQFLPPCDKVSDASRDMFRSFAEKVLEDVCDGWNEGHEEDLDNAFENGKSEGYQNGHETGYEKGLDEGRKEGHESGYNEGYEEGKRDGIEQADSDRYNP